MKKLKTYVIPSDEASIIIEKIYAPIVRGVHSDYLTIREQDLRLRDIVRAISSSKKYKPQSGMSLTRLQKIRELINRRIGREAQKLARKAASDPLEQEIAEIEFGLQLRNQLTHRLTLLHIKDSAAKWQKSLTIGLGVATGATAIGVAIAVAHVLRRNEDSESALKRSKNAPPTTKAQEEE